MISLLASIVGFMSSIIPEILKFIQDKSEKQHAKTMFDKQLQMMFYSNNKDLEKVYLNNALSERTALYSTYKTGIGWIDAINGSVRPVLAYSFFIIYTGVKFLQYEFIKSTPHIIEYIDILWSSDDQAIFAIIISFYFGQRTFSKLRYKKPS